jgi:hypothetical protein
MALRNIWSLVIHISCCVSAIWTEIYMRQIDEYIYSFHQTGLQILKVALGVAFRTTVHTVLVHGLFVISINAEP